MTAPVSAYAQRMIRLSQRIFTEYPKIVFSKKQHQEQHEKFLRFLDDRPHTSGTLVSMNYYPRYGEMYQLMEGLREHGLFRNEHRDFQEEVARLRVLRGKQRKNMRLLYPKRMPELAPCCKQSSKK
ncbi:unnamed protein product [Rotaria sp. Silwood2]|nr:unnamed protein product [Rotaria sp. Silwood2]CAF2481985.1 unnamed protein product [Rotaria sp. Silwood2]CAF2741058.1 unnamed protein product [Rotaria sp. Silwood2]CAF2866112.1 unnamed protein product [Rotaria sp. Silwood2]CAF3972859.1 unnamed protein product [Rotaria sp. Silwood2]